MIGLPPSVRIYFATGLTTCAKGPTGCAPSSRGPLRRDPYEGHLFVFVGKSKDKVKILFWDRSGFVLYMKRLEKGRFPLPAVDRRLIPPSDYAAFVAENDLSRQASSGSRGAWASRPASLSAASNTRGFLLIGNTMN